MCNMGSMTKQRVSLEEEYKGCRTKLHKFVQEQQGEVECYV